uniref:Uncharacterized protein n=1 Tax=Anguilla anguilla TaxID=7936 RepID=A0A0E9T3N8_ANGAN
MLCASPFEVPLVKGLLDV